MSVHLTLGGQLMLNMWPMSPSIGVMASWGCPRSSPPKFPAVRPVPGNLNSSMQLLLVFSQVLANGKSNNPFVKDLANCRLPKIVVLFVINEGPHLKLANS